MHSSHRPLSASHKVCLLLKERILNGEFPLSSLLPAEDVLVHQLQVSRVSLREGIKQLEALGWLRIERGVGTRVTSPDFRVIESSLEFMARFEQLRFDDVHALRRLIELEVVVQAARHASAADIEKLKAANQAIRDQRHEAAGYIDADVAFHDCLMSCCPNPVYRYIMQGFQTYLMLSRQLSYCGPDSVLEAVAAHERIIDAIAAGDADAARQALREHFHVTEDQLAENQPA